MTSKHLMISICVFGLLAAVALWPLSCEANEHAGTGYLVFGDSQSFVVQDTGDARHNWPFILQQATGLHFFNLSRGGRKLSDGHVANYLRMANVYPWTQQAKGVIIALGSLDALFSEEPIPALHDAVDESLSRRFEVICLLPPDNKVMTNEKVREEIAAVCPVSVDMSLHVGPSDMVDQVHFGQQGHAKYATALFWWFALNGRLQ